MIRAAVRYFLIVFSIAFLFGVVRTLWLTPAIGAVPAVLVEAPLILVISFVTARAVMRRYAVTRIPAALVMGLSAFALLMASEAILAILLFGLPLQAWLTAQFHLPGVLGLAAQIMFALMPVLILSLRKSKRLS